MALELTVIILTFNEAEHIARAIGSIKGIATRIVVVDSGSTDGTVDIAKQLGAKVYYNEWVNYASQFNYALNNTNISTEWVMRLDSDEYIDTQLTAQIMALKDVSNGISGFQVNRRMKFLGHELQYGGMSKYWMLRIWRHSKGVCEQKWMDEHIIISEGEVVSLKGKLIDDNKKNIGWWITKHNSYSSREVVDIYFNMATCNKLAGQKSSFIRVLKKCYLRAPVGFRSTFYFLYRYFFRLGVLDGYRGFLWNFLQGWWYRVLVDIKLMQLESHAQGDREKAIEYVNKEFGIKYKG